MMIDDGGDADVPRRSTMMPITTGPRGPGTLGPRARRAQGPMMMMMLMVIMFDADDDGDADNDDV
mgnify:CR=1 FL=1